MLKDPVCGKRMNRNKAKIIIEHEGIAYFLCCSQCQSEFESAPEAYARPEVGEKVKKGKSRPHHRHPPY